MKKMVILVVLSILAGLGYFLYTSAGSHNYIIKLTSNKNTLRAGDALEVYWTLENKSNKTYRFSKLNNILSAPFNILNKDGKQLRSYSSIIYSPKDIPDKPDLYLLKPNQKKTFTFKFLLKKGKIPYSNYDGYFLYYERYTTSFLLDNQDELYIEGEYHSWEEQNKYVQKKFGYKNMYNQNLKSNLLKIKIDRAK
ncbi:MAG: hypothetical protein ACM3WV_05950 [Bacillota bacterium]